MSGWFREPCEYGHFDCSYKEDGPCGDENVPPEGFLDDR